ncbi:MAG: PilZ domain-containing protein [Polyangiaceae bacterium]
MQNGQERRAQGMKRVPVQSLVEICGRDGGSAPPFEAQSVDVSGRGMHVRTAYLPEVGSPLVCRFENHGQEIVVEGLVAWNLPEERGGEFGIQFTALDSGSVEALRQLCDTGLSVAPPDAAPEEVESPEAPAPGSRVRLHIDGLGAPMKASVRDGTTRRVHVASNLEFLKVGRSLELEGGAGERRPAKIHAVDVRIDAATQVPQLVVSLKFEDVEEHTPEPSVIDSAASVTSRSPHLPMGAAFAAHDAGEASTDDAFYDDEAMAGPEPGEAPAELVDDEDEILEDAGRFSTRMSRAASVAGEQAKRAGETAAHFSGVAARGLGRLFKGAASKVGEYRKTREGEARPKRTTAPPPSGVLSASGRTLRRQFEPSAKAEEGSKAPTPAKRKKMKKIAGAAALALLATSVTVVAMKKPAAPPGADVEPAAVSTTVAAESPAGDVTQVDDQGNPIAAAAAPAAPAAPEAPVPADEASGQSGGVSADVPLFGPTPMATMEPAPLGPPPELGAPAADGQEASEEEQEKAAASAAADESFEESPKSAEKPQKANPSSVKPWGKGNIHTPTIHRLRLDQPGGAIKGAMNPTGFTVVVPAVKVMESARGIQKRDSRIARVRTRNGSFGAEISFQFQGSVPGYRVRLRKDYVEFLISAPDKSGVSSTKSSSKSKKKSAKKSSKKKSG